MSLHYTFGLMYHPLRIINKINRSFSRKTSARLRVLSYHDMSEADEVLFEKQLRWIRKTWDIVDPTVFSAMVDGDIPIDRDTLLLTFDDGTISNLHVAERVLQQLDIHAVFFIVANYALITKENDWREFASQKIILNKNPKEIPDNFRNMSIQDLQQLIDAGHTIGAHTATHARLSTLSLDELHKEIINGGDLLEKHLSVPIVHFAYPFGDFNSINAEASKIACKRFKYVYTGMRGDNGLNKIAGHIRRDSNDPHDSLWYTGVCLEGGVDFLYDKKYRRALSWNPINLTNVNIQFSGAHHE